MPRRKRVVEIRVWYQGWSWWKWDVLFHLPNGEPVEERGDTHSEARARRAASEAYAALVEKYEDEAPPAPEHSKAVAELATALDT